MTERQTCTLGLWNETVPGITFDEKGVSNYAYLQKRLMDTYPRGEKGASDWKVIVNDAKEKSRGSYDCIVGVSGGVDSSYLLYLLKTVYKLNPLALTLDNGWSTDIAVENIKKMTSALDIDLETYVIDYEEIKDLLRAYMLAGLPWIDFPTDLAIKSIMYKYAAREKVKYVFRGNDFRSEGKQPRPWTYGDHKQLKAVHRKYGRIKRLKTYPNLPFSKIIYNSLFRKIKEVRPYYYLDYSKQAAKAFLEKEFDWKDYGGHHHENGFTKYAMSVWLPDKFGIDKRIINLSAQVLSNTLSRDEALDQLNKPALGKAEKEDLSAYILKKLDISSAEYIEILDGPNKSYHDYPGSERLLSFLMKPMMPFIKMIYKQIPMTFVEMEMNNKQTQ